MTCRDATTLLSASLDNELTDSEELALAEHVVTCEACRIRLARLERARAAFRGIAPPARSTRAPRTPVLPPAAAAALALTAALILLLALFFRSPAIGPSSAAQDLVFMELEQPATPEPCFYATDCGIESAPQMP